MQSHSTSTMPPINYIGRKVTIFNKDFTASIVGKVVDQKGEEVKIDAFENGEKLTLFYRIDSPHLNWDQPASFPTVTDDEMQICEVVKSNVATVYLTRQHYGQAGVQAAIEKKPRPGQPRRLSSEQESALTVLACSDAPEGHAQWSVRCWLTKQLILASLTTLGEKRFAAFSKNALKPWLKERWGIGKPDGEYLARLEDVLDLYAQLPVSKVARLCFDECFCQLLADFVEALPMVPGQVSKQDYEYIRLWHFGSARRTKKSLVYSVNPR